MPRQPIGPRVRRPAATCDAGCERRRTVALAILLVALLCLAGPGTVHATDCNRATASPLLHVTLPGAPFTALPSADGCWLFVSLTQGTRGVAVLSRADGVVTLKRTVSLPAWPMGMALTHDGALLVVAEGPNVAFLDVRRMTAGTADPVLGYWSVGGRPGSIYVSITADDRYLAVSNEAVGSVSVVDLAQARSARFARPRLAASIGVGFAPVGLAVSSDNRFLFATVQSVTDMGWRNRCAPENHPTGPADHPEGAVVVIDMKLAAANSRSAVLRRVPAGCSPVRVITSAENGRVYVAARGSNELLAFREGDLSRPGPDPRAGRVAVGTSPVGVAILDKGRKIVVAGSDRFSTGTAAPSLYVLGAAATAPGSMPLLGTIPSRGFPREIRLTADGRTLLVTNFDAGTLEMVDLGRAPWELALSHGQRPRGLRRRS